MFYFMLELCKSFLSFLLFNYIVRIAPRAQDIKMDLLLLLLLLLLLYINIEGDKSVSFPSSKSTAHA